MRIVIFALFSFMVGTALFAQEKMYIHKSDKMTLGAPIASTDSIYFTNDQSMVSFRIGDTLVNFAVTEIDSITFGEHSSEISLMYNGTFVTVFNPMAFEGVGVSVEGSDVIVHAATGIQDIHYNLSGNTADGMFKIYSDKRFYLNLKGINITNPDGPAINNQANKKAFVVLADGTSNVMTDGATYSEPPLGEDQDGTFFSEGDLVFSGNGTLTINSHGVEQHGLSSDDEIEVNGGVIAINSAAKDGIHANDGVLITGGTVSVTATGDGIDGDAGYIEISGGTVTTMNISDDTKGISCDSTLVISGGVIDINVNGDQSKGIKCDTLLTLSGGIITIHNSGDAVLVPTGSGSEPSFCSAIKSDGDVLINGAEITMVSSGKAGRGISADGNITMASGSLHITATGNGATYTNSSGVADAYVSNCLNADSRITLEGGSVTTSSSGSGGKGFNANKTIRIGTSFAAPTVQITTTGARILVSGSGGNANYAEAKAVKCDSAVIINSGNITIASADDGIKSESAITINDGTLTILNSKEGLEAPYITFNGGNVHVAASDDCINATFGTGGEQDDGSLLKITGGYLVASTSGGDGLDSNGDILITGGTTIVHGPPQSPEVGMDFNGTCDMNGGFLVISGTNSNMTQAPNSSSDQYCLKIKSSQSLSATTLFHIQNASGGDVLTFQPSRAYYSIIFSSDALVNGASYSIYTGGTCTGTKVDGLYTEGTYSGGNLKKTFTITSIITSVNF
jgi:hypothetical protein